MDDNANYFQATWEKINEIRHAMVNALETIRLIENRLAELRTALAKGIDGIYDSVSKMMEDANDKIQDAESSQEETKKTGQEESPEGKEER